MAATDNLRDDPIAEALLEIRFAAPELEEVLVGRLSDIDLWRALQKTRLPAASIPEPLRAANPGFKFMPTIEIHRFDGIAAVRIGGNVLSLHFVPPYQGWENAVSPCIEKVIDATFNVIPQIRVTRMELRYINVFTIARHHVNSMHDLAVELRVGGERVDGPINVTFVTERGQHISQTRVASRQFLQGTFASDAAAVADIDVVTPTLFSCTSREDARAWVKLAHIEAKKSFHHLLPKDLFDRLRRSLQ